MKQKKDLLYSFGYDIIHLLYWGGAAPVYGFMSAYLIHKGLGDSHIGMIISVSYLLALFVQPFIANFADRQKKFPYNRVVSALVLILFASSIAVRLWQGSKLGMALIYGFMVFVCSATIPFINTICFVAAERGRKLNYGLARAVGSAGYAVFMIIVGKLVGIFGDESMPDSIIIIYGLLFLLLFFYDCGKPSGVQAQKEADAKPAGTGNTADGSLAGFVKRYMSFTLVIAGFWFSEIAYSMFNSFLYQVTVSKGGTLEDMSLISSISAMVEIPMMVLFPLLTKKLDIRYLLKTAAVFMAFRVFIAYIAGSVTLLYVSGLLQMLSYAIMYPALVYYAEREIDPSERSMGQSFAGSVSMGGTCIGSLLGGYIIQYMGVGNMLLVGTLAGLIGIIIIFFALAVRRRPGDKVCNL